MDARFLNTWNGELLIPGGSSATKAANKTGIPTFIHVIFFLCECPLKCIFVNEKCLTSTSTPKLGRGCMIRHMDSYFKSSTSASNQQERVFHSSLFHESPSHTWLASASVPYRAKKQMTSIGHPTYSPLQKPLFTALSPAEWHYKVHLPSFNVKTFSPSLIARQTLSIMLKLP